MSVLSVALTGGIGAGKTTVARLLAQRGAILIDSDVLSREVVEPGTPGLEAIVERFGPSENMKEIARQISARAQGNPFFANEMIDSLIEKRIVVRTSGNDTQGYRQAKPVLSWPVVRGLCHG